MRCPAIEGIETLEEQVVPLETVLDVECVAPLLRGLKRTAFNKFRQVSSRKVECVAPLLRGLKPNVNGPADEVPFVSRMRCPAIEGIETCRDESRYWDRSCRSNALPRY